MRYLTFGATEAATYQICLLVPELNKKEMMRHYVEPHLSAHIDNVLAYDLFKEGKKTKVDRMREYLADLLPILEDLQVTYLVVADADYFKLLTKSAKAEAVYGYILDVQPEFGNFKAIYCPNYRAVFYDPAKTGEKISQAFSALNRALNNAYDAPGVDIIHFAAYPKDYESIRAWLQRLLDMDADLAIDIEAFSLKHHEAGIGTIGFAWSKTEGIAFPVDYEPIPGATQAPYGRQVRNEPVRELLREFFREYLHKAIWHSIGYDGAVLIYQLFMYDLIDTVGLLEGLEVMLRNFDDTRLITYLATNSCAGNKLSLKDQAQEYAGNYAQSEINDITKIPLDVLLRYNLIDSLSTWFVYEKHWDTLVADEQLEIYETLFKPAMFDIIQMQLTGLPVDIEQTKLVNAVLQSIADDATARMQSNPIIQEFVLWQTEQAWEKDYQDRKAKAKNPDKIKRKEQASFPLVPFNPNSNPQLQALLYEDAFLGLPILERTQSKAPAVGGEVIEALVNHAEDEVAKDLLRDLVEYKAIDKLLTAFLPHFLASPMGPDGWHYLFGHFNLGGTISGRLSSSDPNLQNLPANVTMAVTEAIMAKFGDVLKPYIKKGKLILGKLIKSCFRAPPGWLFAGLDFASLEDRISALTTKDPNKLKVYTDGFDGHCLRAQSYFPEAMPDIETAPEGARCFQATIGSKVIQFHEQEAIAYLGQNMTGKELWDQLANIKISS
jgi:DNA polymerase-1